ncbi:MAG TPA: SRPBCC family protein [Allosphingosinicella sp.]|nr:SRPBCC family protein [Allosphingosinicella sp.]
MRQSALLAAGLAALAAPASAEVKSAAPGGFEVESRAIVAANAAQTYAALGRIAEWWNGEHTYSGDAANLRLEARAGGCFCETIPKGGGSIEHMRVVYAQPGVTLRLQGGLGPLQQYGVAGTLTWSLKPAANGTAITQTYVVGGYIPGGADKLAPMVDKVLAEQLGRLQKRLGPGR